MNRKNAQNGPGENGLSVLRRSDRGAVPLGHILPAGDVGGGWVILWPQLQRDARYDSWPGGCKSPGPYRVWVTFADVCVLCGGPVAVWGPSDAKCVGWCGLPQERLEDMTPEQRTRTLKILQRVIAIETASDVEVKEDVL